jgi:hypothetical protein
LINFNLLQNRQNLEEREPLSSAFDGPSPASSIVAVDTNLDTSTPDTYQAPPAPLPYDVGLTVEENPGKILTTVRMSVDILIHSSSEFQIIVQIWRSQTLRPKLTSSWNLWRWMSTNHAKKVPLKISLMRRMFALSVLKVLFLLTLDFFILTRSKFRTEYSVFDVYYLHLIGSEFVELDAPVFPLRLH